MTSMQAPQQTPYAPPLQVLKTRMFQPSLKTAPRVDSDAYSNS